MGKLAIVGAGIVGAWTALECLELGHEVTIIEPGPPGGPHAASYGNGGWIMESSLLPVATPGILWQVPSLLLDRSGPFTIRWPYLPSLSPWLLQFVRSGARLERVRRIAESRHHLLRGAVECYEATAAKAALSHHIDASGLLFVYPDEEALAGDALAWRIREEHGHSHTLLDESALRSLEPGLGARYRAGALIPEGRSLNDPGAFVAGLIDFAVQRGARLFRSHATGWRFEGDELKAVATTDGEIETDRAILCAGIASKALAAKAGDKVLLESERGYHLLLKRPRYTPRHPVMPSDGKMAITPMRAGLRVAGQVELASSTADPDWRRIDVLRRNLARVYPDNAGDIAPADLERWFGHRPSTPDSLPVIGRSSRSPDLLYGFGHGHSGIGMAPGTARVLARLACDLAPGIDLAPYGIGRFR